MSVEDCLAHKWLADESPERPLALDTAAVVVEAGVEQKDLVSTTESMEELVQATGTHQVAVEIHRHNVDDDEEEEEEDQSSIQSFDDDQSEEGASSSDKENSLVFNQVHNHNSNSNNISISSCSSMTSSSSHSSTEVLFPDAPTTPKVLRKAPSETPPSVKALVKKFQVDSVKQQMGNAAAAEAVVMGVASSPISAIHPTSSPLQHQSACFVSQIPKLVNSPKSSSYATSRYSGSPRTGSPAKSTSIGGLRASSKGLLSSLDSSSNCERKNMGDLSSSSPVANTTTSSNGTESSSSPLKSPSSRYAQVAMACVICGEFACRHQTTTTPGARKPILGMEQRITC